MYIVIGKAGCPYCEAARQLLVLKSAKFNYFDIDSKIGKLKKAQFVKQGIIPQSHKTVPIVIKNMKRLRGKSKKKNQIKKSAKRTSNLKFVGGFEELKKLLIL